MSSTSVGGKFRVEDQFSIRGRGMVLAGSVVDGKVKVGMTVSLPSVPKKLTIKTIEMIHVEGRQGIVGLLFPIESEKDALFWKDLSVEGLILDLYAEDTIPS